MIDLSQAKSLRPERERIELMESIVWLPFFLKKIERDGILFNRLARGNGARGSWFILILGIVFLAIGVILFLNINPITNRRLEPDTWGAIFINILIFPTWSTFIW